MATGSAQVDYRELLGLERAQQLLCDYFIRDNGVKFDNRWGCWLTSVRLCRKGYGRVDRTPRRIGERGKSDVSTEGHFVRKGPIGFRLHRIAFLAWHGHNIQLGMEASHLCHRQNCFNPTHVVEETAERNRSRRWCLGTIYCREHGSVLWQCGHNPPCLRSEEVECCFTLGKGKVSYQRSIF